MDNKPTKLRKVKTIAVGLDTRTDHLAAMDCEDFDKQVNEALADGWYMVRRYTLPSYTEDKYITLVAELQRYDDYDE